jgi:hypothetical protein
MRKIDRFIQFIKDNPYLSVIVFLMLVLLIIVAFTKKDLNAPKNPNNRELYYVTEDFTVNYMPNGDIIVQTRNPDLQNLELIRQTLGLPDDANVILDIPGASSTQVETDLQVSTTKQPKYDMDLSEVGN